jgi:hypothetical protein
LRRRRPGKCAEDGGELRRGRRFSVSSEQIAPTNVRLHADMTEKPLTIDGGNQLAMRSTSAYRLCDALMPVLDASEYADRF